MARESRNVRLGDDMSENSTGAAPAKARKLLLVDDDYVVRRVGQRVLVRAGFDVLTAETGEKALSLYQEYMAEIALVIMDMRMPGMNGAQAFNALREMSDSVPVLFSSGCDAGAARTEVAPADHVSFIQKPYPVMTFLAKVQAAL